MLINVTGNLLEFGSKFVWPVRKEEKKRKGTLISWVLEHSWSRKG